MKSQQKAVSQKEVAVGTLVDASVGRNAELVHETEVAELKGGAGDCIQKELKKRSQQTEK